MTMRLIKVCKDLNIRMKDAVEFLDKKGIKIVFSPNYKLPLDLVYLLQIEFHKKKITSNETSLDLIQIDFKSEQDINKEKTNELSNPNIKKSRLKDRKKRRHEGIVINSQNLSGYILHQNEEIFFFQSSVKNMVFLEVGDKVSYIIRPSQNKPGKFVAEEIEIITKLIQGSRLKFPIIEKIINENQIKYNDKIYDIPNSILENLNLVNGIAHFQFEDLLNKLELIIKRNKNLHDSNHLIEILKLDNSKSYPKEILILNIDFWLLWFSDFESNRFIKLLNEVSDDEIIKKLMIAHRMDENFTSKIYKLYSKLPPSIKLKLWLNDIYGKFDYKLFSNYYFTLNSNDRKIFNRRAKAFMSEEITTSIYKLKEPWKLFETLYNENHELVQIYSATWKSIWFRDGYILICIDKEPKFSEPYIWDFSEEKLNLLNEYISGKKLSELKITVIGNKIKNIEGLDYLEEIIWKLEIQREIYSENIGSNILHITRDLKIPANMLIKNRCIQFLNQLQLIELEPTRIIEKIYNLKSNSITIDVSLLYSIPINNFEIAIIWESLELEKSKRTHIFKCSSDEYKNIFNDIENNLVNQIKIRSKLNSSDFEDVNYQKKLKYLSGINHDNLDYKKWESDLFELLPELKNHNIN